MRTVVRFIGRVLASRAGHVLFVIHLCLAIHAFAGKPTADIPEHDCPLGLESSGGVLAGRPFHYHYESALLKTLLVLDSPSIIPASLLIVPIEGMFSFYAGSWVAALILLFFSSAQWWLIGYWIECIARAVKRTLP